SMRSIHDAKWRNIAAGARQPAHHREPPDAGVLMHDAVAGDQRAIADLDPSGEQRVSRDDGGISDAAIVRDVRILHEEVVVADDGDLAALAAAMNRGALAKDVAIADPQLARTAGIGNILWLVADDDIRMDNVRRADFRFAENG